jgi:hypothetical protein
MNYFEAFGRYLISHGFDFDKFFFFPAIPLMGPDTLILAIGKGNNALGKSQCLLLVGKNIPERSDVFAVFHNTNHDQFILPPRGVLAIIKESDAAPGVS